MAAVAVSQQPAFIRYTAASQSRNRNISFWQNAASRHAATLQRATSTDRPAAVGKLVRPYRQVLICSGR